ncbi:unnamed protein product [Linum tenue]|uniref:Uncharacterized protein n=1 Tax=Linum tenue TaxID=586396 RepID=A0AAV0GUR3_9ROSI|nr:unnamed protein product [Linum tenue]
MDRKDKTVVEALHQSRKKSSGSVDHCSSSDSDSSDGSASESHVRQSKPTPRLGIEHFQQILKGLKTYLSKIAREKRRMHLAMRRRRQSSHFLMLHYLVATRRLSAKSNRIQRKIKVLTNRRISEGLSHFLMCNVMSVSFSLFRSDKQYKGLRVTPVFGLL